MSKRKSAVTTRETFAAKPVTEAVPPVPPPVVAKDARKEFTKLHEETTQLLKTAEDGQRELTADEQAAADKNFARMDAIKKQQENQSRLAGLAFSQAGGSEEIELPAEPPQNDPRGHIEVFSENELKAPELNQMRAAFNGWIKNQAMPAHFGQRVHDLIRQGKLPQHFATITTATASGALLPKEVSEPLVPVAPNTLRQALASQGVKPITTPTAEDISLPVATPSAGGVVSETANSETENPASMTNSILLHPKTYQSGSTWFSNQVLQSVNFDLFSEMLPALMYAKELAFENDAITAIAGDSGITQAVATATVSGLVYNNLVGLNRKLPKRYQFLKVIVLSKDAYTAAEQLVTTTGYPILVPDAQNQELKRFNGTPVVFTDYLSGFSPNSVTGFVMSLIGFRLRDVTGDTIARTVNYPPRPAQQGFNLIGMHAIGYDVNAMATLVCPAS